MTPIEEAIVRTVSALSLLGAPPTISELVHHLDIGRSNLPIHAQDLERNLEALLEKKAIMKHRGRYLIPSLADSLKATLLGEEWMPRKLRKAKRIARWLVRLGGVRAVFLCNRTAFGLPRDEGDLDFFVVVRHGSIWQTRALGGLPFVLLGDRPKPGIDERDVVCLSFFLSDQALNLRSCALQPDDVYLRHWFLGLLPLVDDGVGKELWNANQDIVKTHHPFAQLWIPAPDVRVRFPKVRLPVSRGIERVARSVQWKYFPSAIRQKANKDTHVMISDEHLKFHVDDGREAIQAAYQVLCDTYGIYF